MMRRMATKAITGHLALGMGLMTFRTVGNPAMHIVAESTGLLSMGTLKIGKILPWALMTSKTRLFYISGKVQGQGFMRVRVAGQAVFQFKMRPAFMTHGALGNDFFPPGRMFLVAIQTGNCSLVLATVAGYCCRLILMTLDAICHIKRKPFRFNLMDKNRDHESSNDCQT
jgi:hypothetical protein